MEENVIEEQNVRMEEDGLERENEMESSKMWQKVDNLNVQKMKHVFATKSKTNYVKCFQFLM